MKRKLILTDLDGTLLPASKQVLPIDLDKIEQFKEQGGAFSIATGRTLQAAQRYIDAVNPNAPVILFNGAAVYDPVKQELVHLETLPPFAAQATQIVLDQFSDVSAEILGPFETFVSRMTPYEEMHLKICQVEPILAEPQEIPSEKWVKVLFAMPAERMESVKAFIAEQGWDFCDFMQSETHFYEMLPKGASKGSALEKIRQLPAYRDYEIVGAGDFDNDLEMLRAADFSACPKNAQPCVKDIVNLQLQRTCEEGAIAELIDIISEDL